MQVNDPTNVTASATGDGSILVSWENAQETHAHNRVEYRDITGSGSWTTASSSIAADATSYEITGLSAANEYEVRVTALNTAVAQVQTIETVADTSGSLGGAYFDLEDEYGTVRVWLDVDDGSSTPPTPPGARRIEVDIDTDDSAATVASAVGAAIDADSEFSATVSTDTVTATNTASQHVGDPAAGDSGFTVTVTTEGEDGDSAAVEADASVFTWPDTAGYYWAARVEDNATDWTYVLIVEGTAPYLSVRATPLLKFGDVISRANLADFVAGPEITPPSYVA